MKYLPVLAALCIVAGCGGGSEPAPERNVRAPEPGASDREAVREQLDAKKRELAGAEEDLAKIGRERQQLADQSASETKTNRLIELVQLEKQTKAKRDSLADDIAALQAKLGEAPAPAAAKQPGNAASALDDLLSANDTKDKEEAERRRKKAEEESAADKDRIAQAEAARKAELEERAKQKIDGATSAQGEGPFEERWSKVISAVRAELQKYKRW